MKAIYLFLVVCLAAAVMPLLPGSFTSIEAGSADFPGWATHWEGKPLRRLPLGWREQRFADGFPGQIAQFTDGQRLILIRYTAKATRLLHAAADCFRGAGYEVKPMAAQVDQRGEQWGRFLAKNQDDAWRVSERIFENQGRGSWSQVSNWFWSAAYGRSQGPWWAVTIMEKTGSVIKETEIPVL
jgi:hypothetical protein